MKFEGEFVPPAMGVSAVPVRIAGPGHIELQESHLLVSGFKTGGGKGGWIALLVVGVLIGGAIVGATFFPKAPVGAIKYVIMGIIGAIVFNAIRSKNGHHKEPMQLMIPWTSVKKIEANPHESTTLLIHLKKFKPKGAIYFRSKGNSKKVCEALQEHIDQK